MVLHVTQDMTSARRGHDERGVLIAPVGVEFPRARLYRTFSRNRQVSLTIRRPRLS